MNQKRIPTGFGVLLTQSASRFFGANPRIDKMIAAIGMTSWLLGSIAVALGSIEDFVSEDVFIGSLGAWLILINLLAVSAIPLLSGHCKYLEDEVQYKNGDKYAPTINDNILTVIFTVGASGIIAAVGHVVSQYLLAPYIEGLGSRAALGFATGLISGFIVFILFGYKLGSRVAENQGPKEIVASNSTELQSAHNRKATEVNAIVGISAICFGILAGGCTALGVGLEGMISEAVGNMALSQAVSFSLIFTPTVVCTSLLQRFVCFVVNAPEVEINKNN